MAKYKPKWVKTKDGNHNEIAVALEKAGCSVYDASEFGGGFPDLVVGRAGQCYLLECKTPTGRMLKTQNEFRMSWRGHFAIVRSTAEALKAVGLVNG